MKSKVIKEVIFETLHGKLFNIEELSSGQYWIHSGRSDEFGLLVKDNSSIEVFFDRGIPNRTFITLGEFSEEPDDLSRLRILLNGLTYQYDTIFNVYILFVKLNKEYLDSISLDEFPKIEFGVGNSCIEIKTPDTQMGLYLDFIEGTHPVKFKSEIIFARKANIIVDNSDKAYRVIINAKTKELNYNFNVNTLTIEVEQQVSVKDIVDLNTVDLNKIIDKDKFSETIESL